MICSARGRENVSHSRRISTLRGEIQRLGFFITRSRFLKLFHGNMNYRTQTAVYNIIIKHFVPRFVDNTVIAYLCGVISLESRRTQPPPNTGAIRKTYGTFRRLFEIGFCFTNRHKRYVIVRIFAAFCIKGIIVLVHIRYM